MEPSNHSPGSNPPKPLFGDLRPEGAADPEKESSITRAGLRKAGPSAFFTREAEYARLRERLSESAGAEKPNPKKVFLRPWYQAAAAVALLLTSLAVIWWLWQAAGPVVYAATEESQQFVLPDHSVVYLKPNSRLTLGRNWDQASGREVWLEGEGYFAVSRKLRAGERVKFVVHTPDLDVEVLGTRFNVSQKVAHTRVVLQEGKVQLRLHEAVPKEVLMQPGQLVDYSSRQGNLVQKSVNPQPFVAWKQEHWVLNNHTLREIAILTEETYGLKVSFEDDSLQDLRLSGKIGTGDVTLLLEALSATHPVRYQLQNNQILLQRRP